MKGSYEVYEPLIAGTRMTVASNTRFSGSGIKALMGINREIAYLIGQVCAFRPEVSLLIELYMAQKQNQRIKASVLGLASGIPQTTSIRWLRYLEEQGWITRTRHETDQRVTYLHLAPWVFEELDGIFRKRQGWGTRD